MQVVTKQNLANFTEKLLENDKKVLDYVDNAVFDTIPITSIFVFLNICS